VPCSNHTSASHQNAERIARLGFCAIRFFSKPPRLGPRRHKTMFGSCLIGNSCRQSQYVGEDVGTKKRVGRGRWRSCSWDRLLSLLHRRHNTCNYHHENHVQSQLRQHLRLLRPSRRYGPRRRVGEGWWEAARSTALASSPDLVTPTPDIRIPEFFRMI